MSKITQAFFEAYLSACNDDDGHLLVIAPEMNRIIEAFSIRQLEAAAKWANREPGCYFKTNLGDLPLMLSRLQELRRGNPMASIVGNKDEIKTIVSFSLDCDANKPGYLSRADMLAAIDCMPCRPSIITNSDHHSGGFHCFWILASPYRLETAGEREYISTLARRWQNRLKELTGGKLDTTGDITRMLRVPGSRRQNGNEVSFHRFKPDWRYSLRELTLEESPQEIRARERATLSRQLAAFSGDAGDDAIMDYIKAYGITAERILTDAGYEDLGKSQWKRPGSEKRVRSLLIADHAPGVNVFSNAPDHEFSKFISTGIDGKRFVHVSNMFIAVYFAGDGTRAKAFCAEALESQNKQHIDLSGLEQ